MAGFRWLTEEELRSKSSLKWSRHRSGVIPLDVGELDCEVAACLRSAISDCVAKSDLGYGPLGRDSALPEVVAQCMSDYFSAYVSSATVILTGGVLSTITECLRQLIPGQTVGVFQPVYPGLRHSITASGCQVIEVRTTGSASATALSIDLEHVVELCQSGVKAFLTSQPCSPTGAVLDHSEACKLGQILQDHAALLILDTIYVHSCMHPERLSSLGCLWASSSNVIVVGSISKCWAVPSVRIGWILSNNEELQFLLQSRFRTVMSPPTNLGNCAAVAALTAGQAWMHEAAAEISRNKRAAGALLTSAGYRVIDLSSIATPYLWVAVEEGRLGANPYLTLLRKAQVAVESGADYGGAWADYVRLNVGTCPELILRAVERMADVTQAGRSAKP